MHNHICYVILGYVPFTKKENHGYFNTFRESGDEIMKNRKAVLIMTDSQRWDMCSCYRDTGLHTPNIDELASSGIRFERAYTTQPVCQPARAGIFCGQYPHSCGSWANSMGISDNTHTIGQRLADDGVHTAYIGKWHLDGGDYFGLGRPPAGWDPKYWFDMRNYLDELTDEERLLSRDASNMSRIDFKEGFTYGHRVADRALRFLSEAGKSGEDFFLAVSFDEPHGPFICPPPYSTMYKDFVFPKSENVYDTLAGKPDYQLAWAGDAVKRNRDNVKISNPYYFGCISFVDYEIGRVIDAVHKNSPDAVIIYTSDHGDMLSSHCLSGKGPAAYDEITRIPFIISGGGIESGRVDSFPVSHINIAPTLMELFGLEAPGVFDGKSLVAQLEDSKKRVNDYVFFEFGRYEVDHDVFGGFQPMRATFDGRFKLSLNLLSGDELYDLERDPGEIHNLILDSDYREVRDRLHDALLDNMNATRDPFRGYYWERRPWREDARPATWDYTLMTRQRMEDERYEVHQLDYSTGLPIKEATRVK